MIKTHGNITSAFLAQNYRSHKHKQEGNRRHLAVWINWKIINKKLACEYIFNNPLNMESGKAFENLSGCLLELGFDLSGEFNIDSIKDILDDSVRVYS